MADEAKLIFAAAAGAIAGPILFFSGLRRLKLRHAVAGTPTSKVSAAAMGKVELKGQALESGGPLKAPFSGRACVWYRWLVEEERGSGKRRHWVTLGEGATDASFLLDDGSGQVRVFPAGAEVETGLTFSFTSGGLFAGSAPTGPLAAHWVSKGGLFSNKRRLQEWRLEPRRSVYALGVLSPPPKEPAGAPASLGAGRNGEPYFISGSSEEEILSSLRWRIWGQVAGGAALCVACVGWLSWHFFDR